MKAVKKFIIILKKLSYYNSVSNLNPLNIKAINDKCHFLCSELDINLTNIKSKIKPIEPTDHFALFWNVTIALTISSNIFAIPYNISFE